MEVTALILANITFLTLAHAQHQSPVCTGLVFGVQYLYLVTIAWSLVAALVFYRQIVKAIHTYGKSYDHTFKISCVLCWVLPLIFPSFALIYSDKHHLNYLADMDGEFGCWISETWKIYTFIVPILAVVAVNTFLGIRVVIIMIRASSNRGDDKDDTWKIQTRHIKSILSLIMLFGVSFLLSLFTYGPQALVFQYLFIIFTCSQGLFIFILFVPLRPEVHSEWKTILGSSAGARLMSPRYSSRTSQATNSSLFNKTNNKIFVRKDSVVDRCVPS
ncbi:adhesion G-protein coupled receptor G2-like [Bolinopsis microptera]|uniref:adhesion G-protein coupled receptor G2-like n=1 Tax=Bolinopsis microptera TaxID=2820187 RepID=UPI003078CD19